MTRLDNWLNQATRQLSKDSAARVRTEIQEHYELEREAELNQGATAEEADRLAVAALGDARIANCQYRNVLLTSNEARILRQTTWEAHAICSRPWLKWLLLALPLIALVSSAVLFLTGATSDARVLLLGAIVLGLLSGTPFLPVYTLSRGRIFRRVRWVLLIGTFWLLFGSDALSWSWLWVSSLWPLAWIEWTRFSIRRKLPVAQWPRQLYF